MPSNPNIEICPWNYPNGVNVFEKKIKKIIVKKTKAIKEKDKKVKMLTHQNPNFQLYTWAFQSSNRDRQIYPEPNNFTLPLQLSVKRPLVSSLIVGSIELEPTQYTIESEWNRVYYDEGWEPFVHSAQRVFSTQEHVYINGANCVFDFEAMLPLSANPFHVTLSTSSQVEIETQFEHGLSTEMVNLWRSWGGSVQLIANGMAMDLQNVIVISPFKLQFPFALTETTQGVLKTTPVPTPSALASVVSVALKGIGSLVNIKYVNNTFVACCMTNRSLVNLHNANPLIKKNPLAPVLKGTDGNLVSQMGFGTTSIPFYTPEFPAQFDTVSRLKYMTLEPGNYTASELQQALQKGFQNDFVVSGTNELTATATKFTLTYPFTNEVFEVSLPETKMENMQQVALFLEKQLNYQNTVWITVRYDCDANRIEFRSFGHSRPFTLTFDHDTLGFPAGVYNGSNVYRSLTPLSNYHLPLNNIFVSYNEKRNKYIFQVQSSTNIIHTTPDMQGNVQLDVQLDTAIYPTLKSSDIVEYHEYAQDEKSMQEQQQCFVYHLPVEKMDPFHYKVNLPSNLGGELTLSTRPYFNLYLNKSLPNCIPARYLGFPPSTIEMNPQYGSSMESVYCVDVSPPKYLLLDMDVPAGSTKLETSNGKENRSVVAKILMEPTIKLDRVDSMQLDVTGIDCVTECNFRILNPDFTPYHFHGVDWSGSLMLSVMQTAPVLVNINGNMC